MSHQAVYAVVPSEEQAYQIVDRLTDAGFSTDDISALQADPSSSRQFTHHSGTKAPEGAVAGASAGGAVGGVLGLLAGIGVLAIPGVGPLLAAGPLLATLSGAAAGATVGGIAGALIGMGIPEFEAKRYETRIAEGNILMSVHATTGSEVRRAKEIFRQANAEDITASSVAEIHVAS